MINQKLQLNLFYRKEIWLIIMCIGIIMKLLLFPIKLGDYNFYLEPWIKFIKENGYENSLKYNFYNYSPSYIYILIAIAKIGFNPLYSIKIVSILFEFILAYFVGKIAFIKYKNDLVYWISFAVVPLIPTLILNGAFWGQCDSIYSAFVLGSLYFILKKKEFLSIVFLGIAISFKIQAIFIFPFYFVMLLRGNIKWYYFILIPVIYLISILPTWFYGRPLTELLTIYMVQSDYYQGLTIYFPNLYVLINDDYFNPVRFIGMGLTAVFTIIFGVILSHKKYNFTFDIWLKLAFLSVIITPFLLPGMHERYLYLGDVMAVLYYIIFRKNIKLSFGILVVSFYAYMCCSRLKTILPLWPAFVIYLSIIILAMKDFYNSLKETSTHKNLLDT